MEIDGKCETIDMVVFTIAKVLNVYDIVFIVSEAYYIHARLGPMRCYWSVSHESRVKDKGERSRSMYNSA